MADKRTQDRFDKLNLALESLRNDRDELRADLAVVKSFIAAMIRVEGIEAEQLAVGLALVNEVLVNWPRPYTPHVPTLAAAARVEPSMVLLAIDMFEDAGVLGSSAPK